MTHATPSHPPPWHTELATCWQRWHQATSCTCISHSCIPLPHPRDPFDPSDPLSPFGHGPVAPNLPGSILHPHSTQHTPLSGTWRHCGAGGHGALGWHRRAPPAAPLGRSSPGSPGGTPLGWGRSHPRSRARDRPLPAAPGGRGVTRGSIINPARDLSPGQCWHRGHTAAMAPAAPAPCRPQGHLPPWHSWPGLPRGAAGGQSCPVAEQWGRTVPHSTASTPQPCPIPERGGGCYGHCQHPTDQRSGIPRVHQRLCRDTHHPSRHPQGVRPLIPPTPGTRPAPAVALTLWKAEETMW